MDREPSESGRPSGTTAPATSLVVEIDYPGESAERAAEPAAVAGEETVARTPVPSKSKAKKSSAKGATSKATATPPTAVSHAPSAPPVGSAVITVEVDDFDDEIEQRPARAQRPAKIRADRADARPWWQNPALQTAASAVVVGVVVAFIYNLGGGSDVPGISGQPTGQETQATNQIDQNQIAALMQKISSNPKDIASLQALGDLYFQAGDYQTASDFDQKVLDIDPNNVVGLLSHGAAQFNLGNAATAKADWEKVIALNPRQAEAYYDLGFLYLSQDPPNMNKVKEMWNKVVEIDPTSEVAKSVQQHLQSFDSTAPSGSKKSGK